MPNPFATGRARRPIGLRALFGIGHHGGWPRWHGHNVMTTITDQDTQQVNGIRDRLPRPPTTGNHREALTSEPFAKFGSALGQPWVSPWERGRPARILVKALPRRQSAGEPTNPVKPIATTLPSLVRAGRPRSQGSQPFPAINPTYWRILQKAPPYSSILASSTSMIGMSSLTG